MSGNYKNEHHKTRMLAASKRHYNKNKDRILARNKQTRDNLKKTDLKLYVFRKAKYRAKQSGIEFTITINDFELPPKCPVFGTDWEFGSRHPVDNSISMDRINSNLGYIPGNVIIISAKANRIKNNASIEELEILINWLRNIKK